MTDFSESREKFARLRDVYRELDDADKMLFWVHLVVAPAIMIASVIAAFGWPGLFFMIGFVLYRATKE